MTWIEFVRVTRKIKVRVLPYLSNIMGLYHRTCEQQHKVPGVMATHLPLMLLLTQLLLLLPRISLATNRIITQNQNLTDDNTLVSENEIFELGFFSPGNSSNRYLGIWYHKHIIPEKTYVWVANRDHPIKGHTGMLSITSEGNLELHDQNNLVWSANSTRKSSNPILQLLDSGNLILQEKASDSQSYLWQSFDYPSDTLLQGMKLGLDSKTGLDRRLTSWKNWDDPSTGNFTTGIVRHSYPELVMWKGETEYSRTGPWNGDNFMGIPAQQNLYQFFEFHFVFNKDEAYYTYEIKQKSMISRWVLNQTQEEGTRQRLTWIKGDQIWRPYTIVPFGFCQKHYNYCGPYGNCVENQSPICQCLEGFKLNSPDEAENMNWTQGCVRSEPWRCKEKNKDGFVQFKGLLVPDTKNTWFDANMTLDECKVKCFDDCNCTAFANSDIYGNGCVIWFGDLIDMKIASPVQDLYIRMAVQEAKHGQRKTVVMVAVAVSSVLLIILLCFISYIYITRRKFRETKEECGQEDMDLPFFDFPTIANATNGFTNKLGEGGFGPVYRGTLADGQEIAVKRLSRSSTQGTNEFKNEVILCSKLQHRNLVKILGCCTRGEEKMLIYEYMPNKSLDYFLFGSVKSTSLDWTKRFNIICGIARGLLYLHQDSRLKVIHRDLKASNILLDNHLNPKISDFGLAKMFGGDQDEGNTNRVAGTHGYMAPEYAMDGIFSTKSDVFSFGILLLEVVSGRKNKGVYNSNQKLNLISHAWRSWKEGSALELVDDCLGDSIVESEVLRCIRIGLLCLQHNPDDRPSMASVVLMLTSSPSTATLSEPKEPGFLLEKISSSVEGGYSSSLKSFSAVIDMSSY